MLRLLAALKILVVYLKILTINNYRFACYADVTHDCDLFRCTLVCECGATGSEAALLANFFRQVLLRTDHEKRDGGRAGEVFWVEITAAKRKTKYKKKIQTGMGCYLKTDVRPLLPSLLSTSVNQFLRFDCDFRFVKSWTNITPSAPL